MWKKLLGTTLIAAFALSSCTDKDVYQGPKENEKEFNTFPFSTVQKDVNLNVNYVNGAVQSNVYFEVYDEMPVAESEYGTYTKRQDVNYLFAAYTKEDGTKIPIALDLTDTKIKTETDFTMDNPCYGIVVTAPNLENAVAFIRYAFDL